MKKIVITNTRAQGLKRCDTCIYWTPRTDIGYCSKLHDDETDADDYCPHHKTEEQKRNEEENAPKPGDDERFANLEDE